MQGRVYVPVAWGMAEPATVHVPMHLPMSVGSRWGVLGPYAQHKGWAPGPVMDWRTGAAGWILWVSLAIMLGDSLTSLGVLAVSTTRRALQQRYAASPRSFGPPVQPGIDVSLILTTLLLNVSLSCVRPSCCISCWVCQPKHDRSTV